MIILHSLTFDFAKSLIFCFFIKNGHQIYNSKFLLAYIILIKMKSDIKQTNKRINKNKQTLSK